MQQNSLDWQFCWNPVTDSYSFLCQNMLLSSIVMISGIEVFLLKQQMVCVYLKKEDLTLCFWCGPWPLGTARIPICISSEHNLVNIVMLCI